MILTATMDRKITGIGETVLDIVFKDEQPVVAVPGGSTFNSLVSLGRTAVRDFPGLSVSMVTETGNDHVGDIIASFMRSNGIGTEYVTRNSDAQTFISLAFLDSNSDAHYQFYKEHSASRRREEKVAGIGFSKDDLVLTGSYFAINPRIREYTLSLLRRASDSGAILLYDINFRRSHLGELQQTIGSIMENCRLSSIVRGSLEDFGMLYGLQDPERIYREQISALCPVLICTCGAAPVHIFTPLLHLQIPVPRVEAVSTIGAGDNFNAGILYSIIAKGLHKDDIPGLSAEMWEDIAQTAAGFSAEVCGSMDNYVGKDFVPEI